MYVRRSQVLFFFSIFSFIFCINVCFLCFKTWTAFHISKWCRLFCIIWQNFALRIDPEPKIPPLSVKWLLNRYYIGLFTKRKIYFIFSFYFFYISTPECNIKWFRRTITGKQARRYWKQLPRNIIAKMLSVKLFMLYKKGFIVATVDISKMLLATNTSASNRLVSFFLVLLDNLIECI